MSLPNDIQSGQVISATWLNRVKDEILRSILGDGKVQVHRVGQNLTLKLADDAVRVIAAATFLAKIKTIANDYLVVNTWDGTTLGTTDLYVAKPRLLQHAVSRYGGLSSLTTVDTQTVDVVDADDVEATWKVAPQYYAGDLIQVARNRFSGVSAVISEESTPLTLMDVNEDARAWVEVPEEEE